MHPCRVVLTNTAHLSATLSPDWELLVSEPLPDSQGRGGQRSRHQITRSNKSNGTGGTLLDSVKICVYFHPQREIGGGVSVEITVFQRQSFFWRGIYLQQSMLNKCIIAECQLTFPQIKSDSNNCLDGLVTVTPFWNGFIYISCFPRAGWCDCGCTLGAEELIKPEPLWPQSGLVVPGSYSDPVPPSLQPDPSQCQVPHWGWIPENMSVLATISILLKWAR